MVDGERDDDVDDGDDRRHEQRAPIELKVEYKRLNTFFYDYTKNISKGGTFIKTDRPLDIGTVFLFRLQVPAAPEPIELRGEVRWVVRAGDPIPAEALENHEPGMGIRFVYDAPDQRRVLERSVEKMMVNSLGQLIYSRLLGPEAARPRAPVSAAAAPSGAPVDGAAGPSAAPGSPDDDTDVDP